MNARLYLSMMVRESRGSRGRLFFSTLCIAIGVAAVVGVAALGGAIEAGIRSQSRRLLAADFVVSARRPLPGELDGFFDDVPGLSRTNVRELATMVAVVGEDEQVRKSTLVELKVVEGTYPFYGELELDPPGVLEDLLGQDGCVVAPELMVTLGLDLGDELRVGGAPFRVVAVVDSEPDRLDFSFVLGPRVFLSGTGLERTSLLGVGNRVRHRALFHIPGDPGRRELRARRDRLREELPGASYLRIQTHFDAQPSVRRGLSRVERYLGLVALLSLILGGIGVAQIVRAWLAERTQSVAILRCLGLRPPEILTLYLGHVVLLALCGSIAGGLVGIALPFSIPLAAPDLLPPELVVGWQPFALLRGLFLGVGVAVLFSLPALTAIWRVPPARVLRAEAEPLPPHRAVRYGALAALALGLFASAWVQGGTLVLAASFTVGLAVLGALLFGGAKALVALASTVPRDRLSPYLAHGVAALARPGAGTVGAIVALGLGVMVVLGMALVEERLSTQLSNAVPEDAPSSFLVDIQHDQWDGVRGVLEDEGARGIQSVPVVMARLAAIDDVPVERIIEERSGGRRRGRWVFTREQRLTWLDELPADNVVVEGELWNDPNADEVSLEEGYAEDMGVGVGSRLRFDVQGVPVDLVVTSLRSVEWQSFAINFFLVVEPGVLVDAPGFRLAAARLDEAAESRVQNRLASAFPNVTLMRIRPIVEKIAEVLRRLAFGVRLLGGFTVLAGIAILAGSIRSSTLHRGREVALLKAMGVTRRGVVALFATEFALSGLVAGILGACGALALSWAFLELVVELRADLPLVALPAAGLASAALAALCGVAASGRALRARPLESLRG